ncbi:hypothetical protein [Tardiphaga sp. 768_D3_N2_1]|uniref:hypothetical protein n=1 Tax=Tardiphaga sp. 768_D3_N2_1 TaxID=3240783 RepID=UPI003F8B93B8
MKPLGFHFRRQAPIKHVIDAAHRDEVWDAFLRGEGSRAMRLWNFEVDRNLPGVMETVVTALGTPTRPA